jgi:hypothetical protein
MRGLFAKRSADDLTAVDPPALGLEQHARAVATRDAALVEPKPRLARLTALTRSLSPESWALLAVAAAVVLANLPYLLGLFDPNPLGPRSGLLSEVTTGLLRGQPTIDPNNGFTAQALGHRAALDWLDLRLPWWNAYEGTGLPLAAEMQSAAMFPATILTLLDNGQLYERMLLEVIAGISTFLLLRRISVNVWASAAAAIAFALNGTFAWFSHAAINPVPFLPLLLLGIEIAYSAAVAGRRGAWWLIAVSGALSVYAGFPEVAYIDTLMAICWFAWRCGCLGRERLRPFAAKAAAGGVVGTLLSAPILIPFLDLVDRAYLGLHEGGHYGSVHITSEGLPQLLLPYVYGPIFGFADQKQTLTSLWGHVGGYLSTSLLLLALLGLICRGRRGLRLALLVWIVLALARMYGLPLLGDVLGILPGISDVLFYRYAFASVELSVIILAALALDDLVRAPLPFRRLAWGALAALALVAVAAIGARPLANQLGPVFGDRPYYEASVVWGVGVVMAGAAAALLRDSRARVWAITLLVAADAMVLFAIPELSAPRNVRIDREPVAFLKRNLGNSRFFTLGPFQPNYGSYFGVASLNVNDVPVPSVFTDYVHGRLDSVTDPKLLVGNYGGGRPLFAPSPRQELIRNLDGYRAAAVRYVLTPPDAPLPQSPSTFTRVFRSPSTWIYRLAGAARYFAARGCTVRPDGRESAGLTCAGPTTLVRRETDYPGWSARIDGQSARIRRADGLFQAVTVGPGSHRVEFSYLPPKAVWGLIAFAAGCAWLLVGAALGRRRRRG